MQVDPTPHLTPEFCKNADNKLVFQPATVEEAAFIAAQLQGMGYRYYSTNYASQLGQAVKGCIYLDTDKTIMVTDTKRDGIACSVDGFRQFFMPEAPLEENARLAPEDCLHRTLVFYPRTNTEARSILSALLKNGVTPQQEDISAAAMVAKSIVYGMIVRDGRIAFAPRSQDLIGAEICSAADLGIRPTVALSAEQATIMAAFNEMGARLEQMSQRIVRLEEAVLPQEIAKPLPKPKPQP